MNTTFDAVEFLCAEFSARRKRNPAYSLRAFSRHLGISPGRLSQVMSRKRSLTTGQLEKIAEELALQPDQVKAFAGQTKAPPVRIKSVLPKAYDTPFRDLSSDVYRAIAEWRYQAMLSLLETHESRCDDLDWLGSRLGLSGDEAKDILESLSAVNLVEAKDGRFLPTHRNLASTNDIPSEALRQYHRQILDCAKVALEEQSVQERDITSVTMGIRVDRLPEAKKIIREFRRRLCSFLEEGPKEEVYALNIQLFKLTK